MNKKNLTGIFWGMLVCWMLPSCDSEIDLYSGTPCNQVIVYSILDCSGNDQLVKIGLMSQQDETGANLVNVPAQPDSFSVSIQEWTGDYNATYKLSPSGNQTSSQMTSFEGSFTPFDFMEYKLVITNLNTGALIVAKTQPLSDPEIISPPYDSSCCWIGYSLTPFEFRYAVVPEGMAYQVELTIQYVDFTTEGDTLFQEGIFAFDPIYFDHSPATDNTRFTLVQSFSVESMLDIFASAIPSSAGIQNRQVYRFIFTIWAGNDALRDYLKMSSTYEDNRKQAFTNVVGGIGFFGASSHSSLSGMYPDTDFLVMLSGNSETSPLKFSPSLYQGKFRPDHTSPDLFPNLKKDEVN